LAFLKPPKILSETGALGLFRDLDFNAFALGELGGAAT